MKVKGLKACHMQPFLKALENSGAEPVCLNETLPLYGIFFFLKQQIMFCFILSSQVFSTVCSALEINLYYINTTYFLSPYNLPAGLYPHSARQAKQTPLPNSLWQYSCSSGNFPKSTATFWTAFDSPCWLGLHCRRDSCAAIFIS